MATDFESSLHYLYGLQSHGIKPGLSTTRTLLEALGDPQRSFHAFHVAGTNGKGSTSAMLASVLVRQGYRVGLYTSPHLIEFTERIRVNGICIPPARVSELTQTVRNAAETHLSEPSTFFEATTVMAFAHFADAGVEYAVVEVGLGGRFDATNVLTPLVSVITTIGLDHQHYLGETLESIAGEKAGIIKRRAPVIVGRIEPGPLGVIETAAAVHEAPSFILGRDFDVRGDQPARFAYRGMSRAYDELSCPLQGRHQLDNAACALAAVETAIDVGLAIDEGSIRQGLDNVQWPGRLELIRRHPDLLLDGAHNVQAAEALAAHLKELQGRGAPGSRGRLIYIFGMMRDKDRRGVMNCLALVPRASHFILTRAAHPRAAEPQELARDGEDLGLRLEITATVSEALACARALATRDDTICVTGSLLVVGEVRAILENTTVSALRG